MTEKARKRHLAALRQTQESVLDREWMWDKELVSAIKCVVLATTASHTIRSRTHSLLSLVRDHIDPPLDQWMKRNQIMVPWKYSELVQIDYGQGYGCLVALGLQGRADDWWESDEVSTMADLLIFFLNFCAAHSSETVKKIYLDPKRRQSSEEVPERAGKGLKIGARSNNKQLDVPAHLSGQRDWLQGLGLCQACGNSTAAQIEYEVVTDRASKVDGSIKKQIAAGVEFASKTKGSRFFCPAHSERDAGSDAYKKGRAQVKTFLSLLHALTFNGVAHHLNSLFPGEGDLAFAKNAIRSKACHPDLQLIAERMSELGRGRLEAVAKNEAKGEVVRAVHRMFFDHLAMTPISGTALS